MLIKEKIILDLVEDPIDRLNDAKITSEAKYCINDTRSKAKNF